MVNTHAPINTLSLSQGSSTIWFTFNIQISYCFFYLGIMNKRYTFIFIGILLYVIYNISTLQYSPVPWFDEVCHASITESFVKNGIIYEEARNISPDVKQLDLAYGPVYAMLQSVMTSVFGFTIFTFRFTNMFFGLVNLLLIFKICQHLKFKPLATALTLSLIAFDPQFNQFLHSGRMDLIGLFFFLAAYLLFVSNTDNKGVKYIIQSAIVGILLGCSYMTNPRILFAFFFFVFYFLYELSDNKFRNVKHLVIKNLVVVGAFVGLFSSWVFYQFGSFSNYIYEIYTKSPMLKEHVGFSLHGVRLTYNMVMHLSAVVCFVVLVLNRKVKENLSMVLFAAPAVIIFLLLVRDGLTGRYYGLVVPFVTILFTGCTINAYENQFSKAVNYLVLGGFVTLFVFKGTYIFATLEQRDPAVYDKVISGYIQGNASVAADFQYYYISKKHNWQYQCLEQNGTPAEKTAYFLKNKYDYFIISKSNRYRTQYEQEFLNGRYQLIGTIEDKSSDNFFHTLIRKLPVNISEGYGGYIYKYIGENVASN